MSVVQDPIAVLPAGIVSGEELESSSQEDTAAYLSQLLDRVAQESKREKESPSRPSGLVKPTTLSRVQFNRD